MSSLSQLHRCPCTSVSRDTPQGASLRALLVLIEIKVTIDTCSVVGGIGGENAGGKVASTEELEAGRRRVTLVEMTSARERTLPAANYL